MFPNPYCLAPSRVEPGLFVGRNTTIDYNDQRLSLVTAARCEERRGGERCALADSQTRTGRDIVRTEEAADQTEEAIIYILRGARYQTLDIS